MSADVWFAALALAVVVAPAVAFVPVTLALLVGRAPAERTVGRLAFGAVAVSFASAVALALLWLTGDRAAVDLHVARWFGVGHYGFDVAYLVDRLSMTLLPLVTGVVLVITRFAIPYLHREPGFARFFGQLMLFAAGESLVVLAGSADVLIIGWECVGLSSALLVAFFHERAAPARAAVRVFTTYRLCDIGLLVGAMALHGVTGSSDFTQAFRTTGWPGGPAPIPVLGATALALCLGLAAAGKSAQLPVGNWLARAMEGPTPSSALFYGGPAVHTGVFLLLRLAPLFERAWIASAFLVGIGLITSLHATLAWRVQTDQKSALAYATMTQLGLIVAECGLGWWMVALAHTAAHLCLRTFQLLRAPSALHDAHILWATNHGRPVPALEMLPRVAPGALYRWLYRFGLERSYCDVVIDRYLVQPVLALGRRLDALERRGFAALGGLGVRRESGVPPVRRVGRGGAVTMLPIAMTVVIALAGIVAAPRRTLTRATLALTFVTVAALSALFCARTLDAVALLLPVSLLPCWFTVADPQARPELRAACGWVLAGTCMPLIVVVGLRASGVAAASPMVASLVLTALLVRLAIPPFHGWLPVLLEHARPSLALLVASTSVTPFLVARVLWPSAGGVLEQARPVLVALGLAGSLYGALLGLVQTHLRRVVGYVLVSQWGAVLVALAAATPESTTGALLASVALGLTSSALVILAWAIENRTGSASMEHQGGLVVAAPHLAVAFLAFGFAHVGFPGSLAFVAEDLMLHGVLEGHPVVGGFVLAASALNAITIFRAYQRTFLGPRPADAAVTSDLVLRERAVAAILLVLVMLAGMIPGPIVSWARRGVVPGPQAEARQSESPRG